MKAIYFFLFSLCLQAATAQPLQRVAPEQVGMDSRKLMYADEAIETAISNKDIPGAVLAVVRNGKMAYLKAYGNKRIYPNVEPMTANTIFDMASCSKSMSTAVCTMILAERGKLRMLDPVSLYIPHFKNWESEDGKEKKVIRIADLMTHTSGLPPYAPVAELEKQYGSPNPDGLIEYIATCKRDFKPQTDFQYSCLNFITLQHIIETISGQSLRDFARENLFDVLGFLINSIEYFNKIGGQYHWKNVEVFNDIDLDEFQVALINALQEVEFVQRTDNKEVIDLALQVYGKNGNALSKAVSEIGVKSKSKKVNGKTVRGYIIENKNRFDKYIQ
jgi:CubicO group peptidase (beta-lactamase class C family)